MIYYLIMESTYILIDCCSKCHTTYAKYKLLAPYYESAKHLSGGSGLAPL